MGIKKINVKGSNDIVNEAKGDILICRGDCKMENEGLKDMVNKLTDSLQKLANSHELLAKAMLVQKENDTATNHIMQTLAKSVENNSISGIKMQENISKDNELMERLVAILEKLHE